MVYQLEVLNPDVQTLLDSLVKLKLIRLHKFEDSAEEFRQLLERLRNQGADQDLSEDEIAREVETVRSKRYARTAKSHH